MNTRLSALLPWAPLPALLLATLAGPGLNLHLPWLLLGMHFELDATGRVFLLFSAILWALAGYQARHQLAGDPHARRFAGFFLATLAGNLLLILAADLPGFYLGYALMTFAAYGLIIHKGSAEALRAGRVYLVMALLGEVLLLLAFLQLAQLAGSLQLAEARTALATAPGRETLIGLLLTGFGIKAGALLLHLWLPLAHPAAPVPASAVLSGVLIKAGLLGWLRFLPLGLAESGWGGPVLVAGLAAAFYGVAVGLVQRQPKVILAYSSISQMGFMTLGVGLGLLVPQAWPLLLPAVTLYALHHALAKGALFLGLGLIGGRRMVLTGFVLLALSLAGAPLTSGALAKQALKQALPPGPWETWLPGLLALAALGTSLLLARLLWRVARTGTPVWKHPPQSVFLAWWLAVLLGLTGPWWLPTGVPVPAQTADVLWAAAWPVLAGGLLAGGVGVALAGRRLPGIPPGDLLWPLLRLGQRLRRCLPPATVPPLGAPHWGIPMPANEKRLGQTRIQAVLVLACLGLLLATLALA
jgi:formate hydrogenlyase subunit 3/multisubunit Na+/H+ antiporter MnhD subunit